jgi:hypothetical protein
MASTRCAGVSVHIDGPAGGVNIGASPLNLAFQMASWRSKSRKLLWGEIESRGQRGAPQRQEGRDGVHMQGAAGSG